MARKPENVFRSWFVEEFRAFLKERMPSARFRVQKHADYVTLGMPDVDLAINGFTGWVELKLVPSCSEKGRKLEATPLQRENLSETIHAGIPAFVLVGLKCSRPRKGEPRYLMACYPGGAVPHTTVRKDFYRPEEIFEHIVLEYRAAASRSHSWFNGSTSER